LIIEPADNWKQWLQREAPALVLLARQVTGRLADAEDAVQEGFLRFWRVRSRARDQHAYLFQCVSSALDELREEGFLQ
jgi:DNA-directed RNA polymerase specialized sigma24 family protein